MTLARKLIIGLGNPGSQYEPTRHNAGKQLVKKLSSDLKLSLTQKACSGHFALIRDEDRETVIAVTGTYMNRSGEAVKCFVERFEIDEKRDLLVVLDDADLQLGRIRLREGGSSGGHKGLESVAQAFGTHRFARLRIGIGRPSDPQISVDEFVLLKFTPKESKVLGDAMERASEAALTWAREGAQKAMNVYNMDSIDSQKNL